MDQHRCRSRLPVSPPDHDRGACGIGFVARTDGDSRREIIDLALTGLARMRHRQAVAADERTGDGAGLLVPIPRDFFARITRDELGTSVDPARLGVVFLFLDREAGARAPRGRCGRRGADAARGSGSSAGVTCRCATTSSVNGRGPPLRSSARRSSPRPTGSTARTPSAPRTALAARPSCGAGSSACALTVASWGFATVTYKALVHQRPAAVLLPGSRGRRTSPHHSRSSTAASPPTPRRPGRGRSRSGCCATTARSTRTGATSSGCTRAATSAPRRPASAPRSCSGRCSTHGLRLRQARRHARAARPRRPRRAPRRGDAGARGVGGQPGPRARGAGLLPLPRLPDRAVGRPGRRWSSPTVGRVGAALDRNGLRPLRCSAAATGSSCAASEVGAVPLDGRGSVRRGRLGPGEMMCVDTDAAAASRRTTTIKAELAEQAAYRSGCATACRALHARSTDGASGDAEDARSARSSRSASPRRRWRWCSSPWPPTPRSRRSRWATTRRSPLRRWPGRCSSSCRQRFAQVTQPADRPPPRAPGDVAATCLGPRRPLLSEIADAARLLELPTFFLYPDAVDALLDGDRAPLRPARLDATFAVADGPDGLARPRSPGGRRSRGRQPRGIELIVIADASAEVPTGRGRSRRCSRPAPCTTGSSRSRRRQDALDRRRHRRRARHPRHRLPPRLRRRRDLPPARARDRRRAGRRRPARRGGLRRGADEASRPRSRTACSRSSPKMGIATVDGYRGAQIFEALGLARRRWWTRVGCFAGDALGRPRRASATSRC